MENLAIDSGAVELTIDGDKDRVIRFYPTDVSFAEAYYALADRFGALRGEVSAKELAISKSGKSDEEKIRERIRLSKSVYGELEKGIDEVFGPGTYHTVFGKHNNIGMVARFFRGISTYVRAARDREVKRYTSVSKESGVLEC